LASLCWLYKALFYLVESFPKGFVNDCRDSKTLDYGQ
jgi:hypothetical protein